MSITWTPILEYTDELMPRVTVNLVFHHWSTRTRVFTWCLQALCRLMGTSLVILEK